MLQSKKVTKTQCVSADIKNYKACPNNVLCPHNQCDHCPPFMQLSEDEQNCIFKDCPDKDGVPANRFRHAEDGSCVECDPFTFPPPVDEKHLLCIKPLCGEREKINVDGTCQLCDEFTKPAVNKKTCVNYYCLETEIKL